MPVNQYSHVNRNNSKVGEKRKQNCRTQNRDREGQSQLLKTKQTSYYMLLHGKIVEVTIIMVNQITEQSLLTTNHPNIQDPNDVEEFS